MGISSAYPHGRGHRRDEEMMLRGHSSKVDGSLGDERHITCKSTNFLYDSAHNVIHLSHISRNEFVVGAGHGRSGSAWVSGVAIYNRYVRLCVSTHRVAPAYGTKLTSLNWKVRRFPSLSSRQSAPIGEMSAMRASNVPVAARKRWKPSRR